VISLALGTKVFLACRPIDLRNGFDYLPLPSFLLQTPSIYSMALNDVHITPTLLPRLCGKPEKPLPTVLKAILLHP
jgi:hypothetical protein